MKKYLLTTGLILTISLLSACGTTNKQNLASTQGTEAVSNIKESEGASSLQKVEEVNKPQEEKSSDSPSIKTDSPEISKNSNLTLERMNSETKRNTELEKAIIKAYGMTDENAKETRYYYNFIDLNDDSHPEVFVQLVGSYTSGTGGDAALIFTQSDKTFKLFQKFTLIRNPIIISDRKTNGWRDIIIKTSGGGDKPRYIQMKFTAGKYPNPSNASILDANAKISGKAIICDEIGPKTGLYLTSSIKASDNKTLNSESQPSENLEKDSEKITYEDQIAVEEAIKAFAKAIEMKDYKTAEAYCTPDFKEYLVSITTGKGSVTDWFSKAIIENQPLKFISAKGYYDDENSSEPNFNITKDRPTANFLVRFDIKGSEAGGYTKGVKGNDGKWRIEGFASGR